MRLLAHRWSWSVPAALAVAGCTVVGPDFEQPEAPDMQAWQQLAAAPGDAELTARAEAPADWWTVFDDPVLDRLIAEAHAQNLTLRTAGIRIYEARAQLGIAVGSQYPQSQQAGAGFSRQRISESRSVIQDVERFIDIDPSFDNWELGIDAAWELDLWGKFRRGVQSADANLIEQIANYDDVLVTLTGDVAATYAAIRTLQERLKLVRENVELQGEALRIAELQFRDGTTTELDVAEATALLNDTESLIPQLENAKRQATNALGVLLGLPPGEVDALVAMPGPIPTPPPDVALGVPADLLRRRPDIRAAELQAAAQSAQIGVAQADLYPSFTLIGSVGLEASDAADLFLGRSFTGVINPGISWNFLNYGRIKNNVRVQDARFQELVVNYQNTVLSAYQEVEDAAVAFVLAQRQADKLATSVAAAERAVRIALLQYRDGTADYTRVLNTQTSLVRGQDRLVATRGQIVANLIALYKALGGGWQVRVGQDFLPAPTRDEMAERTDWGKLLAPGAVPESDDMLEPPVAPRRFERGPDW
ncbi:MAG: efflux transporter outer membrane subunit [Pseudomonadota bacterium]